MHNPVQLLSIAEAIEVSGHRIVAARQRWILGPLERMAMLVYLPSLLV